MTPEECSAEVLRTLFGYLPEEIRGDGDTGTVITVPAAFNQMQKDSTMAAADAAGLGRVALMQEPVAAVMSVMRSARTTACLSSMTSVAARSTSPSPKASRVA
jgi:molecular chaperone DnaK